MEIYLWCPRRLIQTDNYNSTRDIFVILKEDITMEIRWYFMKREKYSKHFGEWNMVGKKISGNKIDIGAAETVYFLFVDSWCNISVTPEFN